MELREQVFFPSLTTPQLARRQFSPTLHSGWEKSPFEVYTAGQAAVCTRSADAMVGGTASVHRPLMVRAPECPPQGHRQPSGWLQPLCTLVGCRRSAHSGLRAAIITAFPREQRSRALLRAVWQGHLCGTLTDRRLTITPWPRRPLLNET